jgi:hypothetical protein
MIAVPGGIFGAWFDRLTMTGYPELVEGYTPYAQIVHALCITREVPNDDPKPYHHHTTH